MMLDGKRIVGWSTIFATYKSIFNFLDCELQKKDCSISKFQILLNLYFNGPMTPVEISRKLNTSRANTTTFIKRILTKELIIPTHERGTLKRPAYKLTREGENYFEKLFPQHVSNVDRVMEILKPDFLQVLEKIQKNIDGQMEG